MSTDTHFIGHPAFSILQKKSIQIGEDVYFHSYQTEIIHKLQKTLKVMFYTFTLSVFFETDDVDNQLKNYFFNEMFVAGLL